MLLGLSHLKFSEELWIFTGKMNLDLHFDWRLRLFVTTHGFVPETWMWHSVGIRRVIDKNINVDII